MPAATQALFTARGLTKVSALGVDEQRVNVVLDFTAPIGAVQTVGNAFRIEVDIVVFRAPEAITVPLGALLRSGPDGSTWVVEGDRARRRSVKTTPRGSAAAMVDEGLSAGERVIMYPADAVRERVRIKVLATRSGMALSKDAAGAQGGPEPGTGPSAAKAQSGQNAHAAKGHP